MILSYKLLNNNAIAIGSLTLHLFDFLVEIIYEVFFFDKGINTFLVSYLYFGVYIGPLLKKKVQINPLICLIGSILVLFIHQRLTTLTVVYVIARFLARFVLLFIYV